MKTKLELCLHLATALVSAAAPFFRNPVDRPVAGGDQRRARGKCVGERRLRRSKLTSAERGRPACDRQHTGHYGCFRQQGEWRATSVNGAKLPALLPEDPRRHLDARPEPFRTALGIRNAR